MPLSDHSFKRLYQIAAIIVSVLLIGYFSVLFLDIILMVIVAVLIALIFNPVVNRLEKFGISRFLSVITLFILVGVALYIGFSILIPKIGNQFITLGKLLDDDSIQNLARKIETKINVYFPFVDTSNLIDTLNNFSSEMLVNSIDNFANLLTSIFSVLSFSVIIPFMTFFFLKDNKKMIKGILSIVPNKYFEMSFSVMQKIIRGLARFVSGWILDAFLVGTLSAIGLAILGIDNAISIGVIAGIGHLIPYFGPVIGGIPAILISLVQFGNFSMLPLIIIMFLIIYTLDNGFFQPNIFSKSTDMHPVVIIILILIGSKILGVFGMLLAVPIATVIKTASKEIYFGYKNYNFIS